MDNDPHAIAAWLSDDERDRLLHGRPDWRETDWQDHCGVPNCEYCEGALVPEPDPNRLSDEDKAVRAILQEQEHDR